MGSAIAECLATVQKPNSSSINAARERIKTVRMKLKKAQAAKKGLLGIEKNAEDNLDRVITDLDAQESYAKSLVKFGDSAYPPLSLDVLHWRNGSGWPKLALLDLDSPRFEIVVSHVDNRWGGGSLVYRKIFRPDLPTALSKHYADVVDRLKKRIGKARQSIHLYTEFSGIIPPEVKQKIPVAKKQFKKVFVLAEAKHWDVKKRFIPIRPRLADPLLVGWDGVGLWLIAHFDMTPVEEYVKREFTV